jgi:hypothetical protein
MSGSAAGRATPAALRAASRRWWRGWLAMAVLLGLLAPQRPFVLTPTWLAGAVCHAGGTDAPAPADRGAAVHIHCTLCLIGKIAAPPTAAAVPPPRCLALAESSHALTPWPGPQPGRPYAPRAPPAQAV